MSIGQTVSHYRILEKLGGGGMGVVYRAEDTRLLRSVALKFLPPELTRDEETKERFVREAQAASALDHPNFCTIHEIEETPDGQLFMAQAYYPGETLKEKIARGPLKLDDAVDYALQMAQGLAKAHAAGIVHRDIKPANVMVTDDQLVKIVDFGIAKLADATAMTRAGTTLGTLAYMSPEQTKGLDVDGRSDLWSLGVVLYEMIVGQLPFKGDQQAIVANAITQSTPAPLTTLRTGVPMELERIVTRALAKQPEDRYQTAADLLSELRRLKRDSDSQPLFESAAVRIKWRVPLAAALAVAVALAGWFASTRVATNVPAAPMRMERLTGSGNVIDATISPDGKYIAYVETLSGQQSLRLRQLVGTQPLELVGQARVEYWGVKFSTDSGSVYFAIKGPDHEGGQLFQIPILGGTPRPLLTGIDSAVTLSPDGRELAYFRENYPDGGASSLMVAGADGSNPRPLATKWPPLSCPAAIRCASRTFPNRPSSVPSGRRTAKCSSSRGAIRRATRS